VKDAAGSLLDHLTDMNKAPDPRFYGHYLVALYNADRPQASLGGLASNELAARSQRDHNHSGFWL
jgi:hypothetical protein